MIGLQIFLINFFLNKLIVFFKCAHEVRYPWAKKGHDWLDFYTIYSIFLINVFVGGCKVC
jgi:hypothetical protein